MISKKYKEIITKLEKNIEDKKCLQFVKNQITDLSICYMDEISKYTEMYISKIDDFNERISNLEKKLDDSEEIHLTETICCPYCGVNFPIEYDDSNHEVTCPECNNLIELDWGDYDDDM